jgi:hypothetical protein
MEIICKIQDVKPIEHLVERRNFSKAKLMRLKLILEIFTEI